MDKLFGTGGSKKKNNEPAKSQINAPTLGETSGKVGRSSHVNTSNF